MQYRKGRRSPWVVQVRDEVGDVQTFSFSKREDAVEAEARLLKVRQRVRAGLERPPSKILFFDFAADWMKQRTMTHPAATWKPDDSKLRRVLLPRFGRKAMDALSTADFEKLFYELMYEGRENSTGRVVKISGATRNRYHALLHKMFEDAIKSDLITLNPISKIEILSEKVKSQKLDHWKTDEEAETYIKAAYDRRHVFGVWAEILVLAGFRVNEATPIKWSDLDETGESFTISRIFEAITGEIVERTKGQGEGGTRLVPVFPRLLATLQSWRLVTPYHRPGDYILAQEDGSHFTYSQFDYAHGKITEAAGVKRIRIHDIRHSFASNAQKAGFSQREIQEMLGHEDASTTEIYTHVDRKHLTEKGRKIGFTGLKVCQPVVSSEKVQS